MYFKYDISHCEGVGCTLKEKCRRNDYFRETGNFGVKKYGECFSVISPIFRRIGLKTFCDMFLTNEPEKKKSKSKKKKS